MNNNTTVSTELVQHPTNDQIWKTGMDRAGYHRAYVKQERARRVRNQRDEELTALKAGGFVDRSPNRFNADHQTTEVYTGGHTPIAQPTVEAPITAPLQVPLQVPQSVNHENARHWFVEFHTSKDYRKRQMAALDFGQELGIVPKGLCGVQNQEQAKKIFEELNSSLAWFRYDRSGEVQRQRDANIAVGSQQ